MLNKNRGNMCLLYSVYSGLLVFSDPNFRVFLGGSWVVTFVGFAALSGQHHPQKPCTDIIFFTFCSTTAAVTRYFQVFLLQLQGVRLTSLGHEGNKIAHTKRSSST